MNRQFLNRKISFMPEPGNIRLMPCPACHDVPTNHHRTPTGEWVCWCGHVLPADTDTRQEWTAEQILEREG